MISDAVQFIQQHSPHFRPQVGVILGSGLGAWSAQLERVTTIPYADIPQFPRCTVEGHRGCLHLGWSHHIPVACLEGRAHLYEDPSALSIKQLVRTLKALGCGQLLVTNAAGSLNAAMLPGALVLVKDHLNLQFQNPLVGPNDESFGPRFVNMDTVYDPELNRQLQHAAKTQHILLYEGVFAGVLGPSFETPAEVRMLQRLGADIVAMSLIPEVIIARHCGMHVAAISAVSNWAAGLQQNATHLSHAATLQGAHEAAPRLALLLSSFFKACSPDRNS